MENYLNIYIFLNNYIAYFLFYDKIYNINREKMSIMKRHRFCKIRA